jgi:hypothetical protein
MSYRKDFTETDDFKAVYAAEAWLRERGFSVGSMCRGSPRGILFGDITIAKWRNLSRQDVLDLHGVMKGNEHGEMRHGPVTVEIFDHAPADAIAAVKS